MNVAIREAKNNLSRYGNLAHSGETVTISKNGKPWFDLVPHTPKPRSIQPIITGEATLSTKDAIAPVDSTDIEGWM